MEVDDGDLENKAEEKRDSAEVYVTHRLKPVYYKGKELSGEHPIHKDRTITKTNLLLQA